VNWDIPVCDHEQEAKGRQHVTCILQSLGIGPSGDHRALFLGSSRSSSSFSNLVRANLGPWQSHLTACPTSHSCDSLSPSPLQCISDELARQLDGGTDAGGTALVV
jgi:hypothetical protein